MRTLRDLWWCWFCCSPRGTFRISVLRACFHYHNGYCWWWCWLDDGNREARRGKDEKLLRDAPRRLIKIYAPSRFWIVSRQISNCTSAHTSTPCTVNTERDHDFHLALHWRYFALALYLNHLSAPLANHQLSGLSIFFIAFLTACPTLVDTDYV